MTLDVCPSFFVVGWVIDKVGFSWERWKHHGAFFIVGSSSVYLLFQLFELLLVGSLGWMSLFSENARK